MPPLIIGHRGASRDAPENTAAAFRLAFLQGADGIEADFRLTRDGTIVCLHDERTGRTAGRDLKVAETEAEEIRSLDVGRWKGESFRGERIPTLAETLEIVPEGKSLFLEIKIGPSIIAPLKALLFSSRFDPDRIRFLSFDSEVIAALKEALPSYRACWLTDYRFRAGWRPTPEEVVETARRCGADGIASRARPLVDSRFVEMLRKNGLEIHLWTVDNQGEALRLHALGVDSIMTNRPGYLRGILPGAPPA
ncbi:glycerophosphodiester phosphodiesterase [Geomonas sp. RF6]|uniref:glycerophosphodiester phosphodiesterase n=1 Tax=Geomonas sp. RF6 TaxID=2897342 RepID=UPI001E574F1E|nr:glycerophosphodiester phosphodiesterase [Geomonas sp. RF6]UFS69228.1 glycerophosphodiester phosphodiesterase [Geomonas sp. RF6]